MTDSGPRGPEGALSRSMFHLSFVFSGVKSHPRAPSTILGGSCELQTGPQPGRSDSYSAGSQMPLQELKRPHVFASLP